MIVYTVKVSNYGRKYWYLNGKLHREDGPAIEHSDGSKYWCLNGELHREDGPAIEDSNGCGSWYLNGKLLTESAFNARIKPCSGKIVEIDGVKYKLVEIL